MHAITHEQVLALLGHCRTARDRLVIAMAYLHGLRASELVALKLSDVQDGFVRVRGLKGGDTSIQPLISHANPLLDEVTLLAAYLRERKGASSPDAPLFPAVGRAKQRHLHRATFNTLMRRLCSAAGIPRVMAHPHTLRHSTAYQMLRTGAPINVIQKYIRHKSLASTGEYLKATDNEASAYAARAFAGAGGVGDKE